MARATERARFEGPTRPHARFARGGAANGGYELRVDTDDLLHLERMRCLWEHGAILRFFRFFRFTVGWAVSRKASIWLRGVSGRPFISVH